jgi:hypothetical protein
MPTIPSKIIKMTAQPIEKITWPGVVIFAPQFGQLVAVLLTAPPQSLQLRSRFELVAWPPTANGESGRPSAIDLPRVIRIDDEIPASIPTDAYEV